MIVGPDHYHNSFGEALQVIDQCLKFGSAFIYKPPPPQKNPLNKKTCYPVTTPPLIKKKEKGGIV